MVKVVGLKGLAESKDRPRTMYVLGKYFPQFESVFGISMSTKPSEGISLISRSLNNNNQKLLILYHEFSLK